jgi:hypothetical protein
MVLSEEFNPGAVIEGVRFVDPFAGDFRLTDFVVGERAGEQVSEPVPPGSSIVEWFEGAFASKKGGLRVMIYQMKVTLRGSTPPIWRRVQVRGDVTLESLHDVLQAVMGWQDYHLHQFKVGDTFYGVPHPDYMIDVVDESEVRLNEVADEGSRFV